MLVLSSNSHPLCLGNQNTEDISRVSLLPIPFFPSSFLTERAQGLNVHFPWATVCRTWKGWAKQHTPDILEEQYYSRPEKSNHKCFERTRQSCFPLGQRFHTNTIWCPSIHHSNFSKLVYEFERFGYSPVDSCYSHSIFNLNGQTTYPHPLAPTKFVTSNNQPSFFYTSWIQRYHSLVQLWWWPLKYPSSKELLSSPLFHMSSIPHRLECAFKYCQMKTPVLYIRKQIPCCFHPSFSARSCSTSHISCMAEVRIEMHSTSLLRVFSSVWNSRTTTWTPLCPLTFKLVGLRKLLLFTPTHVLSSTTLLPAVPGAPSSYPPFLHFFHAWKRKIELVEYQYSLLSPPYFKMLITN